VKGNCQRFFFSLKCQKLWRWDLSGNGVGSFERTIHQCCTVPYHATYVLVMYVKNSFRVCHLRNYRESVFLEEMCLVTRRECVQ
jgi:hypothetical protein